MVDPLAAKAAPATRPVAIIAAAILVPRFVSEFIFLASF
jgi:hypothetical protein